MNILVACIMVWVSITMNWRVPDRLPTVRFLPDFRIEQIAGDRVGGLVPAGRSAKALYRPGHGVIYLWQGFDPENDRDVSYLVHEIVHFMQDTGSHVYECRGHRERIAYQVQALWLRDHGGGSFSRQMPAFREATSCETRSASLLDLARNLI